MSRNRRYPAAAPVAAVVSLVAALVVTPAGCRDAAPGADRAARTFATAERAAWALLAACDEANAGIGVGTVLGAAEQDLLARRGFGDLAGVARLGAAGLRLEYAADDRVLLLLGPGRTALPVPLVRDDTGWRFVAPAGEAPGTMRVPP